ncbi:virion structural protein [Vibrio phage D518]
MSLEPEVEMKHLTTAEIEGRGDFDELMRAAASHIQSEYDKDRITGKNYSDVYLGVMTQVLQSSVHFLLQKGITHQQIQLLQEQIEGQQKQNLVTDKQLEVMDKQIEQTDVEIALANQRLLTEIENTKLVAANTANALKQSQVLDAQIAKIGKEVEVLTEQKWNAQAQRLDTVDGRVVAGSIGKQQELYSAQINGFERDAEQKLTKILLDTWSVSRSTNDAVVVPSNADNTSIDEVIGKARTGIGLSAT